MNSETLGLLFTTTQIEIFSTRFKAFETEFTAKTSLRTFLTIYMVLNKRLTQVGKDPYLLELSEFHQIGIHAYPSPRRATLLLAPSRTDSPISHNPRKNVHLLSLKLKNSSHCQFFSSPSRFPLHQINNSINYHHVLSSRFFTHGTI